MAPPSKAELTEVHRIVGGEIEAQNVLSNPDGTYHLDTAIAVCGQNYCLMTSYESPNDAFKKVYKLNEQVLLGVSGTFDSDDNPLEPLIGENVKRASLEEVVDIIEKYLSLRRSQMSIYRDRKYLIAGKEFDGQFCIVSLEFTGKHMDLSRNVYRPSETTIATAMSLPNETVSAHEVYERYKSGLLKCRSVQDVRRYIEKTATELTNPVTTPDLTRVVTKAIFSKA